MCGQLLSENQNKSENRDSFTLVSDELKAAVEAATKGSSRRPAANQPNQSSEPNRIELDELLTASPGKDKPQIKSSERANRTTKVRNPRERLILIILVVITVIALAYAIYNLIPKHNRPIVDPSIDSSGTVPPPAVATIPDQPATDAKPAAPLDPALAAAIAEQMKKNEGKTPKPTPDNGKQPAQKENQPNHDPAVIADSAAKAVRSYISATITRVAGDLGVNLPTKELTISGAMNSQGDDNQIVLVSFQGNGFSGSMNILLTKFDQGYNYGWKPSHFKDFTISFSPALSVKNDSGGDDMVAGASISGGFEPLAEMSQKDFDYNYSQ